MLFPFYKYGNGGQKQLSNLPKVRAGTPKLDIFSIPF